MLNAGLQVLRSYGGGVIWGRIPFETPVIPAKAGSHSFDSAFPKVCRVDSRFRGNDCGLERACLANDTGTSGLKALTLFRSLCYGQMFVLAVIFLVDTKEALRV